MDKKLMERGIDKFIAAGYERANQTQASIVVDDVDMGVKSVRLTKEYRRDDKVAFVGTLTTTTAVTVEVYRTFTTVSILENGRPKEGFGYRRYKTPGMAFNALKTSLEFFGTNI
jgi:hypothetical protein